MKPTLIRVAIVLTVFSLPTGLALRAQAPQGPGTGVQVAVPQGNAQDQTAATTRQQQQQQERARLATLPVPRTADGHIVLGNTATLKGVWIGGGLGFCNANTVAAPASLNPGAAGPAGAAVAGGAAQAVLVRVAAEVVVAPDRARLSRTWRGRGRSRTIAVETNSNRTRAVSRQVARASG